jgi:hypothetical protein
MAMQSQQVLQPSGPLQQATEDIGACPLTPLGQTHDPA